MRTRTCIALGALLLSAGCAPGPESPESHQTAPVIRVAVTVYALQWLVERIGDSYVEVTTLPVAHREGEPLTGAALTAVEEADLLIYIGNLGPSIEGLVNAKPDRYQRIDVSRLDLQLLPIDEDIAAEAISGADPHIWLDPKNMSTIAGDIQGALALEIGESSDFGDQQKKANDDLIKNLKETQDTLNTLRSRLLEILRHCADRALVVEHPAFGYLTEMADMEQISLKNIFNQQLPDQVRKDKFAAVDEEYGRLQAQGRKKTAFGDVGSTGEAGGARQLLVDVQRQWKTEIVYLETLEEPPEKVGNAVIDYENGMTRNAEDIAVGLDCDVPASARVSATSEEASPTTLAPTGQPE